MLIEAKLFKWSNQDLNKKLENIYEINILGIKIWIKCMTVMK